MIVLSVGEAFETYFQSSTSEMNNTAGGSHWAKLESNEGKYYPQFLGKLHGL